MLHNISQHYYQNIYHHGPSVRRINISSTHRDGGFRLGSPEILEPSTPQREASSIYWLFQDQT